MSSGLSSSAASSSASSHALTACGECWTSAIASENRDRSAMGSSSERRDIASPRCDADEKNRNTSTDSQDRLTPRKFPDLERAMNTEPSGERSLKSRPYAVARIASNVGAVLRLHEDEVLERAVVDRMQRA